jgi:hypothetical protein
MSTHPAAYKESYTTKVLTMVVKTRYSNIVIVNKCLRSTKSLRNCLYEGSLVGSLFQTGSFQ